MLVVMKLANDPKTVNQFRLPGYVRVLGWLATVLMICASWFFFMGGCATRVLTAWAEKRFGWNFAGITGIRASHWIKTERTVGAR
jgi:hypothetical protein